MKHILIHHQSSIHSASWVTMFISPLSVHAYIHLPSQLIPHCRKNVVVVGKGHLYCSTKTKKRLNYHLITDLSRCTVKEHVESIRVAFSTFQRSNVISDQSNTKLLLNQTTETSNKAVWNHVVALFMVMVIISSSGESSSLSCDLLHAAQSCPVRVFRHAAATPPPCASTWRE